MHVKKCSKCQIVKPSKEFHKCKTTKDLLDRICKDCSSEGCLAWQRSLKGLASRIYNNQRGKSKRRGHMLPDYSLIDLREWLMNQSLYYTLHQQWINSNYDRNYVPSCDRIDDDKPYMLCNIQLMTWKENDSKGSFDLSHGRNAMSKLSNKILS